MGNIYLENHQESPPESLTISASTKINPHEICQNLHPVKLIYLNIFCKKFMYSSIVLFIVHVYRYCFFLVSCHGSAVGTLHSESKCLAEVTERYIHTLTS